MVTAPDDYCELCDLPRSQCIHGLPPPGVKEPIRSAPKPRKRPTTRARSPQAKVVPRRWTSPDVFKPHILTVLNRAGGQLEAEELFLELEILVEDQLLPGDSESTPEGELRWRHAARRARLALIEEGLMRKATPGLWQLA